MAKTNEFMTPAGQFPGGHSGAAASPTADREFALKRVFDAPQEIVFRAYTDPEHISQWWGPVGFTNTVHEMDVRPGGVFRITMHGPDGVDYPNKIVYEEVVRPERLVYLHGGDIGGDLADDQGSFHVTVDFVPLGKKTQVTMRGVFTSKEIFDELVSTHGILEGGVQTFDRLGEFLAKA